jgi:hypothetical protein
MYVFILIPIHLISGHKKQPEAKNWTGKLTFDQTCLPLVVSNHFSAKLVISAERHRESRFPPQIINMLYLNFLHLF